MGWLLSYFLTYLTGGVTFIPLLVFVLWYFSSTVPISVEEQHKAKIEERELESRKRGNPKGYSQFKVNEFQYLSDLNVDTVFNGWLTVTDEHYKLPQVHPDHYKSSGTFNGPSKNSDSGSSDNGFIKMVRDIGSQDSGNTTNDSSSDVDSKQLKEVRKKNRFYAVLKHGNLFLYPDASETNVQHVIVLSNYFVSIWPHTVTEGRLFTKSTAICLLKKKITKTLNDGTTTENSLTEKEMIYLLNHSKSTTMVSAGTYFLYADTNVQKEDWYFALLRATSSDEPNPNDRIETLNPRISAKPLFFNTADMIDLIQTINSTESQATTMWINAILGRLFLGVYKTAQFEAAIRKKLEEKLQKIRTPGFLDELQVGHMEVGHSAPFITNPKLKQLLPDGTLVVEFMTDYTGEMCVEIATKVVLNLGSHFKEREINVNLRVTLRRLHGPVRMYIKPPPTDRLWYCYMCMPEMDLEIEPIVSSRPVNYNLITNMIEKKFEEAIKTSLVYPFMDDFVFFRPEGDAFRGGIWDPSRLTRLRKERKKQKKEQPTEKQQAEASGEDVASISESVVTENADDASLSRLKFPSTLRNDPETTPKKNRSSFSLLNVSSRSLQSVSSSSAGYNGTSDEKSDLGIAAAQIKNGVSNSVNKFKSWYSRKTSNSSSPQKDRKPVPQMISNRRKRSSNDYLFTSPTSRSFERSGGEQPPSSGSISSPEMFISERMRSGRSMNTDSSYSVQQPHGVSTGVESVDDESLNRRPLPSQSDNTELPENENLSASVAKNDSNSISDVNRDQQQEADKTSLGSNSRSIDDSISLKQDNMDLLSINQGQSNSIDNAAKATSENTERTSQAVVKIAGTLTTEEKPSRKPPQFSATSTLSRRPPPKLPPPSD